MCFDIFSAPQMEEEDEGVRAFVQTALMIKSVTGSDRGMPQCG